MAASGWMWPCSMNQRPGNHIITVLPRLLIRWPRPGCVSFRECNPGFPIIHCSAELPVEVAGVGRTHNFRRKNAF